MFLNAFNLINDGWIRIKIKIKKDHIQLLYNTAKWSINLLHSDNLKSFFDRRDLLLSSMLSVVLIWFVYIFHRYTT